MAVVQTVRYVCSSCGRSRKAFASIAGQSRNCDFCKHSNVVPSDESDLIEFTCPCCSEHRMARAEWIGQARACLRCGVPTVTPAISGRDVRLDVDVVPYLAKTMSDIADCASQIKDAILGEEYSLAEFNADDAAIESGQFPDGQSVNVMTPWQRELQRRLIERRHAIEDGLQTGCTLRRWHLKSRVGPFGFAMVRGLSIVKAWELGCIMCRFPATD